MAMTTDQAAAVQPYATPRLHVRWLPAALAANLPAFWHVTGHYPADSWEPCYRVTAGVFGRFHGAIEALAQDHIRQAEVAGILPVLDELAGWVVARFGSAAYLAGLAAPEVPEPPPESPRFAMSIDRGINAAEHSLADMERYLEKSGEGGIATLGRVRYSPAEKPVSAKTSKAKQKAAAARSTAGVDATLW